MGKEMGNIKKNMETIKKEPDGNPRTENCNIKSVPREEKIDSILIEWKPSRPAHNSDPQK